MNPRLARPHREIRRIDAADRRARLLDLTAPGRKLVKRLTPKSRAANERILTPLSPAEREVFVNLLPV